MKRFETWFLTLMIAACVVLGIVSIALGSWINLAAFTLNGIVFGMNLHREIKARRRA